MERKRKAEYPTDLRRFRFAGHRPTKRLSDDPSVRHFNSDAHLVIRRGEKKIWKRRFLLSSLLKTVFLDGNSMFTAVALRSRIAIARGMGVFFAFTRFCTPAIKAYLVDGLSIVTSGSRKWKSFNWQRR